MILCATFGMTFYLTAFPFYREWTEKDKSYILHIEDEFDHNYYVVYNKKHRVSFPVTCQRSDNDKPSRSSDGLR